jgi:3-hydroxyisobutyrate dehydrogenase
VEKRVSAEFSASTMPRVGFVGLGSQGGPMAEMIGRAGFSLTVWARRPEVSARFAATGAAVASDLTDLGRRSDLVGICVVDDHDVAEVAAEVLGGIAPGGSLVVHSTVHPRTVRALAARAALQRVDVLDAPVIGGGGAASRRQLAVAVGGDPVVFKRCQPMLECFGDPIIHVGPIGAAQQAKLLYNLLFVVNAGLHDHIASLAVQLGLDRAAVGQLLDQLRQSEFARRIARREATPEALSHAVQILAKDVTHATALMHESDLDGSGLDTLGAAGLERLRRLAEAGCEPDRTS